MRVRVRVRVRVHVQSKQTEEGVYARTHMCMEALRVHVHGGS